MPKRPDIKHLVTVASILIGFLFVLLLKTQGVLGDQGPKPEAAISSLVQTEQENQQLANENDKLRQELVKYTEGLNASSLAEQQLTEARMNAGLVPVSGPGIRITLDDSSLIEPNVEDLRNYFIHEEYIRNLVNYLWNGGAEAIAVNGQRLTSTTEIFCSGSYIQINGTRQMPPYTIEAIGDSRKLQSALDFYMWEMLGNFQTQYGITRRLEVVDNLRLPAGSLKQFRFAEPVKEGT
ncbi:DUF881 domain-containing protein [Paradesulfitobacterium ferrireducens]|uniref:DUF881 domain-containing protein n=1 Tax=Paradesulfitobacterium ferrireducens TaxID=2816476 RepID=UPI001A90C261|nr:DUF881 domain-containing protein [Paradesulfitobacterium ferrireducens]